MQLTIDQGPLPSNVCRMACLTNRDQLLAEMKREEECISLLEQRLNRLDKKRSVEMLEREALVGQQQQALNVGGWTGQDPFDLVFPDHQTDSLVSNNLIDSVLSLERQHEEEEDWQAMQPIIRQFCYTQVIRRNPNDELYTDDNECSANDDASMVSYRFDGYFVVEPSITATFLVTFQLPRQALSDHDNRPGTARVTKCTCQLRKKKSNEGTAINFDEPLEWLATKARPSSDPLHLAAWIYNVHRYLAFDRKRRGFLAKNKDGIRVLQVRDAKHVLSVTGKRRRSEEKDDNDNETSQHRSQSFVWSYKFQEHRDVLRLTQQSFESGGGLSQLELDALVQVCDNQCTSALSVIHRHLNATTIAKFSDDYSSTPLSSDSNDESPSVTACADSLDTADRKHAMSPSGRRRSAYEIQRLRKIERNEAKLQSLGLVKSAASKIGKKSQRYSSRQPVKTKKQRLVEYRVALADDPAMTSRKKTNRRR